MIRIRPGGLLEPSWGHIGPFPPTENLPSLLPFASGAPTGFRAPRGADGSRAGREAGGSQKVRRRHARPPASSVLSAIAGRYLHSPDARPNPPQAGDLAQMPFENLERPVDLLVTGPPCPPWAGTGAHSGFADDRSFVFVRIVQWIIILIRCGGLWGCVLENVTGLAQERAGRVSALTRWQ
eukprot:6075345-Pyramimonas_sp.AAC.1